MAILHVPGAQGQHFIGTAFDSQEPPVRLVRVPCTHDVVILGPVLHPQQWMVLAQLHDINAGSDRHVQQGVLSGGAMQDVLPLLLHNFRFAAQARHVHQALMSRPPV